MPPTEHAILTSFLLPPAPLPTILSLNTFTLLFPSATPPAEIQRLYRHLVHQRALLTDLVAASIEEEVQRGRAQRRAVVRQRRRMEAESRGEGEVDEEVLVEKELFGATTNLPTDRKHHTPRTIIPALEAAEEEIEREIEALEKEAEELLESVNGTVGGLSDLRYGKFGNAGVGEEVVGALKDLGRREDEGKSAEKNQR